MRTSHALSRAPCDHGPQNTRTPRGCFYLDATRYHNQIVKDQPADYAQEPWLSGTLSARPPLAACLSVGRAFQPHMRQAGKPDLRVSRGRIRRPEMQCSSTHFHGPNASSDHPLPPQNCPRRHRPEIKWETTNLPLSALLVKGRYRKKPFAKRSTNGNTKSHATLTSPGSHTSSLSSRAPNAPGGGSDLWKTSVQRSDADGKFIDR